MSDGTTEPDNRIGQNVFKAAADARAPSKLIERLLKVGIDEERIEELAWLIRRAGSLIYQRPDAQRQAARDQFIDGLRSAIVENAPNVAVQLFDDAV